MYVLFLMEMKQMDIVVSANNGETALILPILPENMPELVEMWNNNTFESINNDINLIGTKGLRTVTLQSFFPVNKNYKFQRAGSEKDGWKYVTLTEDWEFSADQILRGNKIKFCDEAVFYDEQPVSTKIMIRQRLR